MPAEGAAVLEDPPFFLWCFLWLFFGGFVVEPVSSAITKDVVETVKSKAKAINKAFFILASFKVVKK